MITIKECIQLLPERFHEEFVIDVLVDWASIKNLQKVFTYYIENIIDELTEKELEPIKCKFIFIEL